MKSRLLPKILTIASLLCASFAASAQSAGSWVPIHSHAPDVSTATPGMDMQAGENVPIMVSLQLRNKANLDSLTAAIAAGKSSQTLSSAQFLSQYAPTQDQVNAVVSHLSQSGYINIVVAPNNLLITADGTASTAKSAFNVNLKHFNAQGRDAYANLNDPIVPQALGGIILAVHGLQTVHVSHTALVKTEVNHQSRKPAGYSPAAWPTVYNGASIPTAANTTIGIISEGEMTQTLSDLAAFVKQAGFPTPAVSTVATGNTSRSRFQQPGGGGDSDGTAEWDIDSQDALGAAGGSVKSLVFYVANSMTDAGLTAAYNAAVSTNVAKVINVSLGECEIDAKQAGTIATDDQIFEAAVSQGQTFVVASGDSGSYECGGRSNYQSYPAVSPYVIAVGGTSLTTTSAGAWSAETVWSCANASSCANDGGSGGGVSATEAAPAWQTASGVLGTSKQRGVPDVAFDADPNTGSMPIIYGVATEYGGTSLATPIFVGFWARIQSAHNNSLVFPATALYKYGVANQSTLFHDVTSGSNGGYAAKAGWDYTTGFGSLNVANFASFVSSNAGF